MSGMFDEEAPRPRQALPPPSPPRSRALMITLGVLVALFLAFTGFASLWTEQMWFDSVGYRSVFTTLLSTRVLLFLVFGLVMAVAVGASMAVAYRFRPVFRPASPEQVSLDRYRQAVGPIRIWLLLGISLLIGTFAGASASGRWRDYLLWRNGGEFGISDPYFNRDNGFYIFDLPWLHFLVDYTMSVAVVAVMAAAVVHYLYGGIRLQTPHDRLSGAAAAQLSVLVGVFVLAKAADYWLGRFDLLSEGGGLITGMTYTDENAVLPARNILMFIAVICALLFFANVVRRTWLLPTVGLGLLVLSSILLGLIWPGIVQQFQVKPTEPQKEAPYIAKNIEATRAAYNIDEAEVVSYSAESELPPRQLADVAIDSPGIRLLDPQVVQQTFEQRQQVRSYYSVPPVLDVDNYTINGEERDVVLAVRELNQAGLAESAQNWANLRTVYTHGFGVIAAFGNQRPADNETVLTGQEPAWAETDIPPRGELSELTPDGYQPRIYFGENSPTYSIVGKPSPEAPDIELDTPGGDEGGGDSTTTYDGQAGVEVGSLWNKVLYAWKFGEPNIVLSGAVNENSKILYDRDPAKRVEKVAPWLTVDSDPFPAVVEGRVVWLLDGYTLSDRYPLSERGSFEEMTDDSLGNDNAFQTLPTDEINYIRNAVKAVVDAYDGTVTLYAWDEEDPMLQAWMKAFPGTVEPRSEIPESILEHMRYPEDMFKVQRFQLAEYHVTDPRDFYEESDRWKVPADPNNTASLLPPYRLSIGAADGSDTFSLTSVYTPFGDRENLTAFVSVDADAAQDEYGTLRVKRLSSSSQIPGPGQIANQIQSDQAVTQALLPYSRETNTRVVNGNLLTLPVGNGLLYVQPLYSLRTSGDGNFPVLRYVAVSFGSDVGVGRTLGEAIFDVLGISGTPSDIRGDGDDPDNGTGQEPDPDGVPGEGNGQGNGEEDPLPRDVEEQIRDLLNRADRKFAQADEALQEGDSVGWAQAMEEARDLVAEAIELANDNRSPEEPPADEPPGGATEEPAEESAS